jgi:hypothetical protein
MMNYYFSLIVLLVTAFAKAQPPSYPKPISKDTLSETEPAYYYIDGDSIKTIELDDVLLLQRLNFESNYERIRYLILKRKVKKVWPYAKMAAERLVVLDQRLSTLRTKNEKKRYSRMVEDYLEKELNGDLKKLSKTEGQILIKLIHRQTGTTAYDLLKRLKSGWGAFWLDKTAAIFDMSLKERYEPEVQVDDFYIEDILLNAFLNEELVNQDPAISYDYYKGRDQWNVYEANLPKDYDSINLSERAERIRKYNAKKARKARRKK